MSSRTRTALICILVLALGLRVGAIAQTDGYVPQGDAADYNLHAVTLVHERSYPSTIFAGLDQIDVQPGLPPTIPERADGASAFRPPTYPYFLAGVYAVSGDSFTAGRLANALLGVLAVWLIFLIARRLWGDGAALAAAAVGAVAPPLVYLSTALMSEPLFIVFELAAILTLLRWLDDRRHRWVVACGVLCGLCALTRANGLVLLLAGLVGIAAVARTERRQAVNAAAVLVTASVLTIVPWTVRNAVALGELVPLTTQAGVAIAGSYSAPAERAGLREGWLHPLAVAELRREVFRADLNEAEVERELRRRGVDFALSHPDYVAGTTWWNTLRMFELAHLGRYRDFFHDERGLTGGERDVSRAGAWVLALLAVAGVAAMLARPRGSRGPLFVWLVPVLLFLTTVPVNGSPRYRAVIDPYLVLLAGLALAEAGRRLSTRPSGRRASSTYSSRSVSDSVRPAGTARPASDPTDPSAPPRWLAPRNQ